MRSLKYLVVFFFVLCSVGCKHKKHSLSEEEPVRISDIIGFFKQADLPYTFGDSNLLKKDHDSALIKYSVFRQFVPDSVPDKVFGKGTKFKTYPMKRVKGSKGEIYLLVKLVSTEKRAAFVLCFDKKQSYIAGMPVLRLIQSASTAQSVTIANQCEITRNIIR